MMHRSFGLALLLFTLLAGQAAAKPQPSEQGFTTVNVPLIEEGKPDPSDTAVTGYLFQPAGPGPYPAIVLIHGCDGMDWNTPQRISWTVQKHYAERYVAHGYVALLLDSFEPRGIDNACGKPMTVSPVRRAWDAYSAARLLKTLPFVDKARLVLQGDSHGGLTTLVALDQDRKAPEHFAAAIAYYPFCWASKGFTAPLLILIGDADDWTPAKPCREMATRLDQAGSNAEPVELHVFPGATHAFDFPLTQRTNVLGHAMAYDDKAAQESLNAIDAFLAKYLH